MDKITEIFLILLTSLAFVLILILATTEFNRDHQINKFFNKIKCLFGKHDVSVINKEKIKINLYFCKNCKKPRKYPSLALIRRAK